MQKLLKEYLNEANKRHKKNRRIGIAVMLLVLLVAGSVAGVLTQYGIAMTGSPQCGLEEHQHGESCYEDVLVCGLEEGGGHTHTDECRPEKELVCGLEETEGHVHTDECRPEKELVCGLEETEGEEESTEGHTHTDACYTVPKGFSCGLEETEGHTHTDACYSIPEDFSCGLEGTESHTHSDACYEKKLTCGKEEHTHTDACYIDSNAVVEDPASWDAWYAEVEWTDNWGENLVTSARMQVGYKESQNNYTVADNGVHKGYSRYGHFSGDMYRDWDAAFVNFCIHYAGLDVSGWFPQEADSVKWQDEFNKIREENYAYLTGAEGYAPKAGDVIFFNRKNEETLVQMGIVSGYNQEENKVFVIEGNCGDEVRENQYDAGDAHITSYLKISEMEAAYKGGSQTEEQGVTLPETDAAAESEPEAVTMIGPSDGTEKEPSPKMPKLQGGNAYITDLEVLDRKDGSAPWDENNEPGNDQGDSNGVVRTFDIVNYTFSVNMAAKDETTMLRDACIELKFVLLASKEQAEFDLAAMSWMEDPQVEEKEDGNGGKYQTLTCKKRLHSEEKFVVPGRYQSDVTIKINNMENGAQLNPVFSVGMENNAESEWKETYAGNVTVSAAPKYNIYVQGAYSYKDTFNFNTGTPNKAANYGKGPFAGRAVKVGVALQLYNDSESKGLKGIAFPNSDEGITFDLEVGSEFEVDVPGSGTGWSSGQRYDVTDKGYMPLLWSFDGSKDFGYGEVDQYGRALNDYDWSRTLVPDNKLENPKDPEALERSCYNGGDWQATQSGSKIAVTVRGWEINPEQMPRKNGVGTDNIYGENIGCFSAGEFVFIQPFNKEGSASQGLDYDILKDYGTGTFHTSIKADNLKVGGQKCEPQDKDNKNVLQVCEIATPGFMSNNVGYLKCGEDGRWSSPGWQDGHFGRGDSYILAGEAFNLVGGFSYEAGDDYGRLCWGSNFMRFEGEKLELEEGGITSCFANGASLNGDGMKLEGPDQNTYVFYATKKDGSKWSGLDEMQKALEQDMIFYKRLADIPKGHICVGILTCFKGYGTNGTGEGKPIYEVAHRARASKDYIGDTCVLLSTSRVWPERVFEDEKIDPMQIQFVYQKDGTLRDLYTYYWGGEIWGWNAAGTDWVFKGYDVYFKQLGLSVKMPAKHYRSGNTTGVITDTGQPADWSTWGSFGEHVGVFYQPTEYQQGGSGVKKLHNSDNMHWGDTLLILGYETGIKKSLMQKDNEGKIKETFSLNNDQRVADYKLEPSIESKGSEPAVQTADVTIVDTLPKFMRYISGSANYGGEYKQISPAGGKQGTVTGGKAIEPVAVENADGTQTLTWTISNVAVGEEMEPIYYSAVIGDSESPEKDIKDSTQLKNAVYITAEGDKRERLLENGNYAEQSITVQREKAESFGKTVSQAVVEEDGTINYTIYYNNFTDIATDALVVDKMPTNGVGGSEFNGAYQLGECTLDSRSVKDIKIYYTMNTVGEKVTKEEIQNGWTEVNVNGNVIDLSKVNGLPAAWAAIGTVASGRSIRINLRIELKPGETYNEAKTNRFVNIVSSGDSGNGEIKVTTETVRRVLEGLTWMDYNRNGLQDEEEADMLSGVKVELLRRKGTSGTEEDENSYEPACYPGTSNPVVVQSGQQVSVRTGEMSITDYEQGRYRFMDLPPGTYAVRFSDGNGEQAISKLKPAITDAGKNDNIDSDGTPFYSDDGSLEKTIIFGIEMPTLEEMERNRQGLYHSEHNDSGFYPGFEIPIQKIDSESEDVLPGAVFTVTVKDGQEIFFIKNADGSYAAPDPGEEDKAESSKLEVDAEGELKIENLAPGTYEIREIKPPSGYVALSKSLEVTVAKDGTATIKDSLGNMALIEDGILRIRNKFYELPSAGGVGIYWYSIGGILLMLAGTLILYKNKCKEVLGS